MSQQQLPGTPSQFCIGNRLFDIHFEIGMNPSPMGGFYACIILGNGGVKFEGIGPTPGHALAKVAADMDNNQIWTIMVQSPGVNQYPFTGGAPAGNTINSTTVNNAQKKGTQPKLLRAVDIDISIPKGQCETQCQNFDHFGSAKCKSFCPTRK